MSRKARVPTSGVSVRGGAARLAGQGARGADAPGPRAVALRTDEQNRGSAPPVQRLADRVLFIDAHLIVLDKPAGLAVHAGPRTPASLEDHLDGLRFGYQRPPQPAHRLDRDTTGCLVLGRHPKAVKRLAALFATGAVSKTYWAVVAPAPAADVGTIDAPLAKISSRAAGWRVVVDPRGVPARTVWCVLDRQPDSALVAFCPETGRTHQIRVHAAHLGCPLVGDPVYGAGVGPMQLHARTLVIPYRDNAPMIRVEAPVPPHMAALGFCALPT